MVMEGGGGARLVLPGPVGRVRGRAKAAQRVGQLLLALLGLVQNVGYAVRLLRLSG